MAFDWDARQFKTVTEFSNYLSTLTPLPLFSSVPTQPRFSRVVMHHTWSPVQSQWRGLASMTALETYYRDQVVWYDAQGVKRVGGWSAGPNLFVCLGSPDPVWDGIFQGTPINHEGVHAGTCNVLGPGIEVVGNFDLAPWSIELDTLLVDLVSVLLRWGGLVPAAVVGHRDCNSPKTCPGSKIDLVVFRSKLTQRMVDPWLLWGDAFPLPVEQRGWGIPQTWLKRSTELGHAVTLPVYIKSTTPETVYQVFDGGMVLYRAGVGGYAKTWGELLK